MDLTRVIIGPVVTEKAERLKANEQKHAYTLWVTKDSTKIDVQNSLRMYYGVEVSKVRVMSVRPKTRSLGAGKVMEKRHAGKKVIVTLTKKSKALDLAAFQTAS